MSLYMYMYIVAYQQLETASIFSVYCSISNYSTPVLCEISKLLKLVHCV